MKLSKGTLFDGRYRLERQLGSGASAQVWVAYDTMAGDMPVAIKVFMARAGMDSYGVQDFRREFTSVFNIQHQNLLTPTNFAICGDTPYLILPLCSNGSVATMVGRASQDDVLQFMHDVASALVCLHEHKILHQDIKPDNILLDDDCKYLVTDFGISTNTSQNASADYHGGTRAYMGPERFEGNRRAIEASDIWALGATAYELLDGDCPYGDHGGMMQLQDEPIPPLNKKLDDGLKKLIYRCLDRNPAKRPTAAEIAKLTQRFIETGNWNDGTRKLKLIFGGIAAAIILIAGLIIVDANRTKTYYYQDYVEIKGVPHGIGILNGSDVRNRPESYRFEYRGRKVRRLSLVNSKKKVINHSDSEMAQSRYSDVKYYYVDGDNLDYIIVSNAGGEVLYKLDYDDQMKTATLKYNDEYNTEMNLKSDANRLQQSLFQNDERSNISRYLLDWDENGRLKTRMYAALKNVPASNMDNIYGEEYEYDDNGRIIQITYLGADKQPRSDQNAMAIRRYEYTDDLLSKVTYLTPTETPAHDGNGASVIEYTYDKYGNRIAERYFTLDGEPTIRTDESVHGYDLTIQGGNITKYGFIDVEGEPCYNSKINAAYITYDYDQNGFVSEARFYDLDNELTLASLDRNHYAIRRSVNDDKGNVLKYSVFDQDENPVTLNERYHSIVNNVDSVGHIISTTYYDEDGNATKYDNYYQQVNYKYDQYGRVTKITFTDVDGNLQSMDGTLAEIVTTYNSSGAPATIQFLNADGKPAMNRGFGMITFTYDERGNQQNRYLSDGEGKRVNDLNGISRWEYVYSQEDNRPIEIRTYDASDNLLECEYSAFDERGNLVKNYITDKNGKLNPDSRVTNNAYDKNNRLSSTWATDLEGNKVNQSGKTYCRVDYKYDQRGNVSEATYWSTDGSKALNEFDSHRVVKEYDLRNQVIHEKSYGSDDKPASGPNANPEGTCKYDQRGNLIELRSLDGYGRPRLSSYGFATALFKYDRRNNQISAQYLGITDTPVNTTDGYSQRETVYNDRDDVTECSYFSTDGLKYKEAYTYNPQGKMTEMQILGSDNKPNDREFGFARFTIEYDQSGNTPVKRKFFSASNALLRTQMWDARTGWKSNLDTSAESAYTNPEPSSISGNWRAEIADLQSQCPISYSDEVSLVNININGNKVILVMRLEEVSTYQLNDNQISEMRGEMRRIVRSLKDELGLPAGVTISLRLNDKANRNILTI